MTRRIVRRHADAHAWANHIRQANPIVFGGIRCDEPADLYDSELRRFMRLPSIHLCQLRQLARTQLAEHVIDRQRQAASQDQAS